MRRNDEEPEVTIDALSGEEMALEESEVEASALAAKLKALRKELLAAQKDSADNLAGWQRAKADLVNFRRTVEEDRVRDAARAKGKVVRSILPALDSFESAMAAPAWGDIETTWRDGVERIAAQLRGALEAEGCIAFGDVHEAFDPMHHECMSVSKTDDPAKDNTLAQVLQKGYRIDGETIRPAKVIVAQYADTDKH